MKVVPVLRPALIVLTAVSFLIIGAIAIPPGEGGFLQQFVGAQQADAQAKKRRKRGLFEILFGRKTTKKKSVKRRKSRKTSSRKKKSSRRKRIRKRTTVAVAAGARSATKRKSRKRAVVVPVIVKKSDTARKVLVIGDFFGNGMAKGLTAAFAANPQIVVVDKAKGLSGLVRVDVEDWTTVLPELIAETNPAYIVSMLGTNDRQTIRENGETKKLGTPEWNAAYQKRVNALGASLRATNLPYTWVGLPPVGSKKMNKDYLYFNELYGKAAVSLRGNFVDVWDGFSDADGNYSRSGPDINGRIVMLRHKDGMNLRAAGRRRLAFYVESRIAKALNADENFVANPSLAFDIESSLPKSQSYDPSRTGKTQVIRLDDPRTDGSLALAGKRIDLEASASKVVKIPQLKNKTSASQKLGRVDDYSWPPANTVPSTIPALAIAN